MVCSRPPLFKFIHRLACGFLPGRPLVKILFPEQNGTELCAAIPTRRFFVLARNPCKSGSFALPHREFSGLASPLLKARVPITASNAEATYIVRECRTAAELRRETGRTGWPGRTQLKQTMKQHI